MTVPGLLLASLLHAAAAPQIVVVLPFEAQGATGEEVERVEGFFRDAVSSFPGVNLITVAETLATLETVKGKAVYCQMDAACIRELAPPFGAAMMIAARVAKEPQGIRIETLRIRISDGNERRAQRRIGAQTSDVPGLVRELAADTIDPRLVAGGIEIDCDAEGVTVTLDTGQQLLCPAREVVAGFLPGSHAVRAEVMGGESVQILTNVVFDRTTVVRVRREGEKAALVEDTETRPYVREAVPPPPKQADATQPKANTPAASGGEKPAAGGAPGIMSMGGLVVGGIGAVLAVLALGGGLVTALTGAVLLASYERTPSGAIIRRPGETAATLRMRAALTEAAIPAGVVIAVLGFVVLLVAAAGAGGLVGLDFLTNRE